MIYIVRAQFTTWEEIEVEADSKEEAQRLAEEKPDVRGWELIERKLEFVEEVLTEDELMAEFDEGANDE